MNSDVVKTDLFILLGLAVVILGGFTQKFYYARGLYGLSNKRAPLWAGRLIFIGVGALFMVIGFAHLFFGFGALR